MALSGLLYRVTSGPMSTRRILTPIGLIVFIAASVIGLKRVEEPELVRRLGAAYVEYRPKTPMFLPRLGR
jgi:protein-S-isoprenylcysteine O-methyltransferase Ste14